MNFQDRGIMIAVIVILLVGGSLFTLWWWRLADKWASAENRRFKRKGSGVEPPRVVMKGFDKPAARD